METPNAFIFTKNSVSHVKIARLSDPCIRFVKDCGLELCGISTGQGSNFFKAFKDLASTVRNPTIEMNGRLIIVFPDVPHLLKSTQNIIYNDNTIATADGWSG